MFLLYSFFIVEKKVNINDNNVKFIITSSGERDSISLKVIPDNSKGFSVKINKSTKNNKVIMNILTLIMNFKPIQLNLLV